METTVTKFYVNKQNPDYSDTLVVFGLSHVLSELMVRQGISNRSVEIYGDETSYIIDCSPGVNLSELDMLASDPIATIKAIPTDAYKDKLIGNIPIVNMDAIDEYFEHRKAGEEITSPIDLDILLPLQYEAIQGYNNLLIKWWNSRSLQPEIFKIILGLYSSKFNNLDKAIYDWDKLNKSNGLNIDSLITGQQIYNSVQGEGQHNVKMGFRPKTKPRNNFWITEWLRAIGFWNIAIPRLVGDNKTKTSAKDRKILIIEPKHLSYSAYNRVISEFKLTLLPETHIRFDTLAVLRFLKTLLNYFLEPEQIVRLPTIGAVSTTLVSGFHSAYYKSMGRGKSLLNYSFLAFPTWIEVYSDIDVRFYIKILEDLEKIVTNLTESHSDSRRILESIRKFLSSNEIRDFLDFTNYYAGYFMQKKHENQYVPSLDLYIVERIVKAMFGDKESKTKKRYADIGENGSYPGFHNIAQAIRNSTVILQRRNSKNNTFRPRYGLNQELIRQSRTPESFLRAIGEFIHTYNAETRRAQELNKQVYRQVVEPSDINDILRMIDDYDGDIQMIAQLLVAYGYSDTNPPKPKSDKEQEQ